jgi:hypothetical protein
MCRNAGPSLDPEPDLPRTPNRGMRADDLPQQLQRGLAFAHAKNADGPT